jgi:hypothetical protein
MQSAAFWKNARPRFAMRMLSSTWSRVATGAAIVAGVVAFLVSTGDLYEFVQQHFGQEPAVLFVSSEIEHERRPDGRGVPPEIALGNDPARLAAWLADKETVEYRRFAITFRFTNTEDVFVVPQNLSFYDIDRELLTGDGALGCVLDRPLPTIEPGGEQELTCFTTWKVAEPMNSSTIFFETQDETALRDACFLAVWLEGDVQGEGLRRGLFPFGGRRQQRDCGN